MRGIEFSGCNSYTKLFQGISADDYDWYIYDHEIIVNQARQKISGNIPSKELQTLFSNSETLIIFMNLQAFPKDSPAKKIYDYDDYVCSACSFVVLVTDVSCIEIYTKTDADFLRFIKNAEYCQGKEIIIKTEHGDARTSFRIG